MKNYKGKMEKYVPVYIDRRTLKDSGPSSRRGVGKSYADADADTIPEMGLSTEREGGYPAKNSELPPSSNTACWRSAERSEVRGVIFLTVSSIKILGLTSS